MEAFHRGPCLIQGQVEPPEDVGNGHSLLIQGKLLSNAVPGGKEGGGRNEEAREDGIRQHSMLLTLDQLKKPQKHVEGDF